MADDLAAAFDELEEELEDEDRGDWEYDMHADMTNEDVVKLQENVKPVQRVLSKVMWKIMPQMWADKFMVVEGYKRVGDNYKNSYCIPKTNRIEVLPNAVLTRQASRTPKFQHTPSSVGGSTEIIPTK